MTTISHESAVEAAVRHMKRLGFVETVVRARNAWGAVDIEARGALASVVSPARPVELHEGERLRGAAGFDSEALLYGGAYSSAVAAFAEERDIALFGIAASGDVEVHSSAGRRLANQGWLSTGPALETMARDDLERAIESYLQAAIDTAGKLGPAIEYAAQELVEAGELGEELQLRLRNTARATRTLAALLEIANGERKLPAATAIREAAQIETLVHRIAEQWEIEYSDLELDASVDRILDR
ncbi:hypothetical protein OH146_11165 [Salinibacterium sp. SYSU T00001]|uniref:hypothetical protein n=1 Tax=Homoserinimonas sedimenticola TaxID=2986805 RepID=UPI0022357B87|nr:hypothetical protein [Salinibacterium sedimenticola]MCW4386332.1 hypothetical protein [Salinibacterium sedimenticola]